MADEEEEDQKVKYWRTKYELLSEDYCRTKERTESLETRLLEMCEESERRDTESDSRIRNLDGLLEEARRRIEQLEAACFRYKNQTKSSTVETEVNSAPEVIEKPSSCVENGTVDRPESIILERKISNLSTSSPTGVTRSPEFHTGHHVICEYHKLPILAKGEGFIYGFRWNEANKIQIV